MRMTRWCFSSAPSETSHFSNSRLRMKRREVRPFIFLYLFIHFWHFSFLIPPTKGFKRAFTSSECDVKAQPLLSKLSVTQWERGRTSRAHTSGCDLTDVCFLVCNIQLSRCCVCGSVSSGLCGSKQCHVPGDYVCH